MIVYFSGTGNSRFAAEFLAKQLGDELLDAGRRIKTGERESIHSDRPWIFTAPIYAWRMANVMAEYIRRTELTGSRDAYFVLTCGSEIGNAEQYAAHLCAEKGLNYKGVLEVVMPENYIAMFNAPGEEESRAIVAKAKPVLEQAGELIRQVKDLPAPKVGLLDKLKSGPINEGFYKFYVKADAFFSVDACTGCGFCVEACPLNNIRLNDGKPVWGKNCTHCRPASADVPPRPLNTAREARESPATSAQRMKIYENHHFTRQKDERGHGQPACPRFACLFRANRSALPGVAK